MNTAAVAMSVAGLVTVIGTWAAYLATVPSGNVPERPVGSVLLQLVGSCLAIAGIVWSFRDGGSPGAAVIAPSAFALMMGPLFLFLLTQRKTPIGDLRVKVGDTLLAFEATTSEGTGFRTDELSGKRTLLKFFRGGW